MELFSLRKNSFFLRKYLTKCEYIVRIFPMSSDIVSHNVSGILLTLWLTFWEDCEEIVVEMNTLIHLTIFLQCKSQYEKDSSQIVPQKRKCPQSIHILLTIFKERRDSFSEKIVSWKNIAKDRHLENFKHFLNQHWKLD